jgi:acyl dehydratase
MDYHHIRNRVFEPLRHRYTRDDSILYALAIGLGTDPVDERQLRFVYERDQLAFPTMAVVLGYPGFWAKEPDTGIDWVRLVHAEQRLWIHEPIPAEGEVIGRTRVTRLVDKGPGKGALMYSERIIEDAATGRRLATVEQTAFCRGDGGLSRSDPPAEPLPAVPQREPDQVCDLPTQAQSALLYRLCGDRNPLHADPEVARQAGFDRPILHGLCTWGVAAHALLRSACDYDPSRLRGLHARFSAPVFPGETLRVRIWDEGPQLRFDAQSVERGITVLGHGVADIDRTTTQRPPT